MGNLFNKLGGRKFALAMIILVLGLVVELLGKNGLSANFVALLLGSSTIFGVANAAVTIKRSGDVQAAAMEPAGVSNGDEANMKADLLADRVENVTSEVLQQSQYISQLRTELETQSQSLATATKLLKTLMKM